MISFIVMSNPVAQPRVKATIRGKRAGVYTPTKTSTGRSNGVAELKASIRKVASEVFRGPLLSGPLRVDCVFVFQRPANKIWKTRPMPRLRHTSKPDRDNLDKLVCDALKGVVWIDDNQICDGRLQKFYGAGDEAPHIQITVYDLS